MPTLVALRVLDHYGDARRSSRRPKFFLAAMVLQAFRPSAMTRFPVSIARCATLSPPTENTVERRRPRVRGKDAGAWGRTLSRRHGWAGSVHEAAAKGRPRDASTRSREHLHHAARDLLHERVQAEPLGAQCVDAGHDGAERARRFHWSLPRQRRCACRPLRASRTAASDPTVTCLSDGRRPIASSTSDARYARPTPTSRRRVRVSASTKSCASCPRPSTRARTSTDRLSSASAPRVRQRESPRFFASDRLRHRREGARLDVDVDAPPAQTGSRRVLAARSEREETFRRRMDEEDAW